MTSTADYHITCLCSAVRLPGTLLSSPTIPVTAPEFCHCSSCRHNTGGLGGSFPKLHSPPSQSSLNACTSYERSATHREWHCKVCGCGVFVEPKDGSAWFVYAGCIEPVDGSGNERCRDVVRVERHDFVGDTVDGGLAGRLRVLGGREIVCWDQFAGGKEVGVEELEAIESDARKKGQEKVELGENLQVKCHCGGVDLRIRRADYASDTQGVVERYIPPNKEKYIAYFCVCRSCRLSTGLTLMPWCYVPPANVTIASTGKPIKLGKEAQEAGANEGTTLEHYKSSEDVYRSFCGTCGATVLYWADEPGHAVVDVAVGLLRAGEGSMARRWLAWKWGRVAWKEEAIDGEILEAVLGDEGKQGIERIEC